VAYDPDRVVKHLAARIALLRHERGLSQAAFAQTLRSTPQWVSQLERGTRSPTVHTLVKIANALGVTLPELFEPVVKPRAARKRAARPPAKPALVDAPAAAAPAGAGEPVTRPRRATSRV